MLLGNGGGDVSLLDGVRAGGGRGNLGRLRRGSRHRERHRRHRGSRRDGCRCRGLGERSRLGGHDIHGRGRRSHRAGGRLRGQRLRLATELIVHQAEPLDLRFELVQFLLHGGRVGGDEEDSGEFHFAVVHALPDDFRAVGGGTKPEKTLEVINGSRRVVERLLEEKSKLEVRGGRAGACFQRPLECRSCASVVKPLAQLLAAQKIRVALLVLCAVPRGDAPRRAKQQREQAGHKASARRESHGAQRSGKISPGAITRCPPTAAAGFETGLNSLPGRMPRARPARPQAQS